MKSAAWSDCPGLFENMGPSVLRALLLLSFLHDDRVHEVSARLLALDSEPRSLYPTSPTCQG